MSKVARFCIHFNISFLIVKESGIFVVNRTAYNMILWILWLLFL